VKRREFLRNTSLVAAGAMLPSSLHAALPAAAKAYDIIVVGAGPAGSIVATRLVRRFPNKSILLIEAGGPTSVEVGGGDFPPYDAQATIFDVPGEYQNIPFQPKGEPYRQKETPFTYQGMGYGGNSQFNGMLFQAAPPFDFNEFWPWGWRYRDLRPYFERVLSKMQVSNTPSTDSVLYNAGAATIAHDIYQVHHFTEVDTSILGGLGERYFSHPYVVSYQGLRGGPVRSYLTSIVNTHGESTAANLDLLGFAKVQRIIFDSVHGNKAVGITYLPQPPAAPPDGAPVFVPLAGGGRVILAAGALMSPRLLLLSGVGPFHRHDEIFDDGFSVPFHISNPGIGMSLFDHMATSLTYEYTGSTPPFQAYHYSDYAANAADLAQYVASRSGPYAQYGPVSVMHEYRSTWGREREHIFTKRRTRQPNVEVFVNPFGVGAPGGPYNGPRTLSAYAMLLRPRATALMKIDKDGFVKAPPLYLTDQHDLDLMTRVIQQLIFLYRDNPDLELIFGPGGRSHPHLNPDRLRDVQEYVLGPNPFEGVYYTGLGINHWGGTCPLQYGFGGVDPATLRVKGTRNIHVVDASLHPAPLSAHPVATIMAVAEKASDILSRQLRGS
jgi:cellobiose dehydrogenase (acceptor)